MKRKELSRLIASALLANITLNTLPNNIKIVSALERVDVSIGDDSTTSVEHVAEESGNYVTAEQMQSDFEDMAKNYTDDSSYNVIEENINGVSEDGSNDYKIEKNAIDSVEKSKDECVYLSDISHDNLSYLQWNSVKKDESSSGDNIHLLVNGTEKVFDKGIGVDTDAKIVYNVSQYSNNYTHLAGYVGVDYRQQGKGDGVDFTIETSNDGVNWSVVDDIGVRLPSNEAYMLYVKIANVKYIRLSALCGPNNNRSYDHAVFANLRLVGSNYDPSTEEGYNGFKTLAQYDEIISSRSVEDNFTNHKKEILERELIRRIGYDSISSLINTSEGVAEALNWLLSDEQALSLFIEAGDYFSGTGYNALKALGKLYNEFKDDMDNLQYKKMLLATAAAYSKDIIPFANNYGGNYVGANPVETYRNFKKLYDENKFVRKSEFESYNMELVRAVIDSRINYDEILWLRDYINLKYPPESSLNDWRRYNGYGYSFYEKGDYAQAGFYSEDNKETWDNKYGFLKYGISYGDPLLYRVWMVMEAGGICWGLSGLGMVVNEVQGIPAIGTFQPGHEAYMLYSEDSNGNGIWSISDDIAGWESSFSRWYSNTKIEHRLLLGWGQKEYNVLNNSGTGNNTSYMLLAQDALNHYDDYLDSMYYNLIANSYEVGSKEHENALNKSLEFYDKNLDSIYGIYKSYSADSSTTDDEWIKLARMVAEKYRYFPVPMTDLLEIIEPKINDEILKIEVDILEAESLKAASVATSKESLQDSVCRKVANSLLGKVNTDLATFSFDGENANQIVINEAYAGSTIQVRVSLDGGDTWEEFENGEKFTTNRIITLTEEQLARINADDDILVGLMGTPQNFTIDIQKGVTITNDILYKNDLENKLIGDIYGLQYSEDEGKTWYDFTDATRFPSTENRLVYVRYRAKGTSLASDSVKYTFTADRDTPTRKYINIEHLSLHSFSTEVSSDKAENIIDGNGNTGWHNNGSQESSVDEPRTVVIKLDEVKYISAVEYFSSYNNGKVKVATVYTSLDGENWVEVGQSDVWANDATTKKLDLKESSPARYVKFVGTETYASPIMSCKILDLFEDTTKTYSANAKIEYTEVDDTVVSKLVLPEGCKVIGDSEHVFTVNGTFEFKFADANDREQTITAEVNSFDESLPTMKYEFDNPTITNQDVTLTITSFSKEDVRLMAVDENPNFDENGNYIVDGETSEALVDEGFGILPNTYVFTQNKTVVFVLQDKNGIKNYVPVTVDWIDKEGPSLSLEYSTTNPTNGNVTVTLKGLGEGDTVKNNETTYTFTSNGSHEFVAYDSLGNESRITATVSWIDRTAPTATVEYDIDSWTNGQVKATLVNASEDITITNTVNGSNTIVFDENGKFTFEFVDKAGNKGEAIAEVTWIDKVAPTATVIYSTKNPTTGPVMVELIGFSEEGVTVKNNENKTNYTFNDNGEFEFVIVDRAGNETRVPVKVDWISETAPNIDVEYSTRDFTNQNVTATLKGLPDGYDVINEDGNTSYIFEDNGSYEFKVKDRDGNILTIMAEVSWIDKEAPDAKVIYSTTSSTNKNVTATIQEFTEDGVIIKNNGGSANYTFEENGYFDFILVDKAGNETVIRAEVNNIDKVVPTAKVVFESTGIKDGKVIAKLTDLSEEVTIINTVNGNDYYEFTENRTFTFRFKDKAGNIGEAVAIVDWINFEDVRNLVKFENLAVADSSNDSNTPDYVRATFSVSDNIEILNNGGSNTVVFDKNGNFTFKARMRSTGYEFDMIVTVDWLSNTANEEENPIIDSELLPPVIVLPSVDDDIPSKGDDSNNLLDEEVNIDNNNSSNGNIYNDTTNEESSYENPSIDNSITIALPVIDQFALYNESTYNVENKATEGNEDTYNNESTYKNVDSSANSSSSSTNNSIENYNAEGSLDNSSYEENSHKGLFVTVASTVSLALAVIFIWIRKLFGVRK